ncbi:hypothetical protein BT96DRAFT_941128 [Gymnopus androsaceus JB14]|uniref:Uncharacterized protein n=1 Tax=Gymnopus androsaceus JB14 TaxID=1447944 RepID=A0A6A4HHP0_9AGAR|nr:hypothetical protein BT96DRAFT_941128 [Gymnopus androsaceus JB14]
MASNGAIPPPIPEVSADLKFDGGVKVGWAPVKRRIVNSLKTQGLVGYTDGTIPEPIAPTITVTAPTTTSSAPDATAASTTPTPSSSEPKATAVFSLTPSLDKWTFRNDQAKGIIESHIDDLPSLMPQVDTKSAREVFSELDTEFAKKDGMRKILTERRLRSFVFRENETVEEFFKQLCEIRKEATEAGNSIEDVEFMDMQTSLYTLPPHLSSNTSRSNIPESKIVQELLLLEIVWLKLIARYLRKWPC